MRVEELLVVGLMLKVRLDCIFEVWNILADCAWLARVRDDWLVVAGMARQSGRRASVHAHDFRSTVILVRIDVRDISEHILLVQNLFSDEFLGKKKIITYKESGIVFFMKKKITVYMLIQFIFISIYIS